MNKRSILFLFAFSFLIIGCSSGVLAGLCKGNDGYYHDCNSYSVGYKDGYNDGYKDGWDDGSYSKPSYSKYWEKSYVYVKSKPSHSVSYNYDKPKYKSTTYYSYSKPSSSISRSYVYDYSYAGYAKSKSSSGQFNGGNFKGRFYSYSWHY